MPRTHRSPMALRVLALAVCHLLALSVAPAFARPDAAQVTLRGRLVLKHSDDFQRGVSRAKTFVATRRGLVRVRIPAAASRIPPGSLVRVAGVRSGNAVSVGPTGGVQVLQAVAAPVSQTRNVGVLLLNFSNDRSEPWTRDHVRRVMFTASDSVSAYFAESSYGRLAVTGDVLGWYRIAADNTGCQVSAWAQAAREAAQAAGVNLSAYTNLVYAFPRTSSCGWGGLGMLPGRDSWTNGYMTLRILGHELSHNFGVHHASTYRCTTAGGAATFLSSTCSRNEYGDPFTIMGSSSTRHNHNWHRGQLGWLGGGDVQTVTTPGNYTLGPASVESATPKVIRVLRSPGQYFHLELRQPHGTHFETFSSTDPAVTGVSIRLAPEYLSRTQSLLLDTTPSTSSFGDAPLAAGRTVTDPQTGISFTVQSVSPSGATVTISFGGTDTTAPTAPSGLLASSVAPTSIGLSWTASSDDVGVTGYRVYRDGTLVGSPTSASFTDSGLQPSTQYGYAVSAVDAAGNESPRTAISVATSAGDQAAPTAPTGLRGTRVRSSRINLTWTASTDDVAVLGYRVYRDGVRIGTTSTTSFTARKVSWTASYHVVAYDAVGNVSPASETVTVAARAALLRWIA